MAEEIPVVVGAHGLLGRQQFPARVPEEYSEPHERPVTMGEAMPSNCRRVLASPSALCTPGCAGIQRDGGCLCDVVQAATEAGVRWRFEIDFRDDDRRGTFWDYVGDPIPGFVTARRGVGEIHTLWEDGYGPHPPYDYTPVPLPEFDCPHCGTHNVQDMKNFHWWCVGCGNNAKERQ